MSSQNLAHFGYINGEMHNDLLARYDEVNRMLYGMIDKAEKFTH